MKTLKINERLDQVTGMLSDAELGRLFRGMMGYSFHGMEPSLSGAERICWPQIKAEIDAQTKTYDKRLSNMEKARTQYITNILPIYSQYIEPKEKEEREEKSPLSSLSPQTPLSHHTPKREDKEEKRNHKGAGFVPPTLEEVRAYCRERNSPVDPVDFFEFFNVGNWIDSRGQPVRNWKQKLITWEKHRGGGENGDNRRNHGNGQGSTKTDDEWGIHYDV